MQRHRRGGDAAVADDDGGYALRDFWEHFGSAQYGDVVVRVHVNEARREHEALGIQCFSGTAGKGRADVADAVAADSHVRQFGLGAAAINYAYVTKV